MFSGFMVTFLAVQGIILAGTDEVTNIALGGEARSTDEMSSEGAAWKAVDGNTDSNYVTGSSCTLTQNVKNPWWLVDTGSISEVHTVKVTSRGDCCGYSLNNFFIEMSRTVKHDNVTLEDKSRCYFHYPGFALGGATITFQCPAPVYARYVKITRAVLLGSLSLCEVQVLGIKSPSFPSPCPMYSAEPGMKYNRMALASLSVPILTHCAVYCHTKVKHCSSINVKEISPGNFFCEFLEDIRAFSKSEVVKLNGWTYFHAV